MTNSTLKLAGFGWGVPRVGANSSESALASTNLGRRAAFELRVAGPKSGTEVVRKFLRKWESEGKEFHESGCFRLGLLAREPVSRGPIEPAQWSSARQPRDP